MTTDKKRTADTVRLEIENLGRARDRAITAAQQAQSKADLNARMKAVGAVGKIAREYTDPAMKEVRKIRDASHTTAKDIRDAAIATAHGIYKVSVQEATEMYEVAQKSINETASAQIRPHEEALRNAQADAGSAYTAEVEAAQKEFDEKTKPLLKELVALENAQKPVEQSEIPYPSESEVKQSKKGKGKKAKGAS